MKHRPEAGLGDTHFSQRGERLAARDYFQFARRLREIVGPQGFLIGHMGFGSAGVFANLTFDAYLPGEDAADHAMFRTRDEAVFRGMLAGSACMPWPVDAPAFTTPETVAKMAAWGFFPHVGLGIRRAADKIVFPLDPDAPENRFTLPYWRLLASIDVDRATIHSLPSQSREAIRSSNPAIEGVVYVEEPERKDARPRYLLVLANLGAEPAEATVTLDRDALAMAGRYVASRVDPADGSPHPHAIDDNRLAVPKLSPWQIIGFRLEPEDRARRNVEEHPTNIGE
jgi:hypothetical protein